MRDIFRQGWRGLALQTGKIFQGEGAWPQKGPPLAQPQHEPGLWSLVSQFSGSGVFPILAMPPPRDIPALFLRQSIGDNI